MPFTPFHMGAAMAIKPVADNRFSAVAFGVAQVFMDIEPGVRMLRDDDVLHGPSHTFWGASLIALLAAMVAWWLLPCLVRLWNRETQHFGVGWLACSTAKSWRVILGSTFAGTYSHLLLDALMHADMQPFAPFTVANPLLGLLPVDQVYRACAVALVVGAVVWIGKRLLAKKAGGTPHE